MFLSAAPVGTFYGDGQVQTALLDFTFDDTPVLEETEHGVLISLDGEETWLAEGDPVVPVRESTILLPQGMRITSVETTYGDSGTVVGSGVQRLASPVALPLGGSLDPDDAWSTVVSTSFPAQASVTYSNHTLSGYNLGTLRVFPVQYDSTADTLTYHSSISVTVTTTRVDGDEMMAVRDSAADWQRVAQAVDNPEALDSYTLGVPDDVAAPDLGPQLGAASNVEYVIITSNSLVNSFQPLVNQKIARGLSAGIMTTESIYAGYSGVETGDNADKIRHFLMAAYTSLGTRWVLLGGDVDVVPQRGVYASQGSTIDYSLATDMYYACLDGPWNGDGDGVWGEQNDGYGGGDIDLTAEVYIGRAPVSNSTEAANFVAKTIRYETTAHANPTTAVWLGEQLDSNTWGSYSAIPIRDQVMPDDWNLIERYDSAGGWSGSDLLGDLNASPHLVNHLGHANSTYNARLYNSQVAGLSNTDPYFMYSQGCYSGSFDSHDLAIAEKHVVDDHGALGVVMNSRYGWYMPGSTPSASHHYAMQFWDAVFNEDMLHLGQANQDSKDDNMYRVGATGVYRWIHFETNLFGDPETPLQIGQLPPGPPAADGQTPGLYNPHASDFLLRDSNDGGTAQHDFIYGAAGAGWTPLAGDFDGDGIDTIGLYDPATSRFMLRNANSSGLADCTFLYGPGGAGWQPIVGDFDGDGTDTIGLYDPATSRFYLRNSNSTGIAELKFVYGPAGLGWQPIVGDFDGDGTDTIGLYNPATSWLFLRNSNTTGVADLKYVYGPPGAGWQPIVGDFNDDGTETCGLYDPAASQFFLRNSNTTGVAEVKFYYGLGNAGWEPIIGKWIAAEGSPAEVTPSDAGLLGGGRPRAEWDAALVEYDLVDPSGFGVRTPHHGLRRGPATSEIDLLLTQGIV
ncbi:MAG: hypothetical protein JXB62_09220 [Pirellulales bacterium]|nr:hypothetical protein [Pirellulales bacterium]